MPTTSGNAGSFSDYEYLRYPKKGGDDDEEEEQEDLIYGFTDERIEKRGDEWCVITHQTGKNMGCYPTKKEAEDRLEQIARFSHVEELLSQERSADQIAEHLLSGSFRLREKGK